MLGELGASGDVAAADGLVHMVFNNNNSGNKLDFFLRREQEIDVHLDADGAAQVSVTMDLFNDLPRKGVRAIGRSGVASGLRIGENRMSLHFIVPKNALVDRFAIDGVERQPFRGIDSDSATVWRVLTIPPDEHVVVELSYSVPDAVRTVAGDTEFVLSLWPQATARPDLVSIVIHPPAGRAFAPTRMGQLTPERTLEWSDRLRAPRTFDLRISGREGGT